MLTRLYYDVEVLSLPAGDTIDMVRDNNCAIYECPANGCFKARGEKKPLFMAFRERNNHGRMTHLYKIQDVLCLNLEDEIAIDSFSTQTDDKGNLKYKGFRDRINYYKRKNKNQSKGGDRWVFLLDVENSIELPFPVEYESSIGVPGEVHLAIKDFFGYPKDGVVKLQFKKTE